MTNMRMTVRYDGADFAGWQTQPAQRTVQETLEQAIASITRESRVRVNASGRTDAGVHALGQVVNFFSTTYLDPPTLLKATNARLPVDVAVTDCQYTTQAFDASKDAKKKMYRYVINDGRIPDPFLRKYAWQPRHHLDPQWMHDAGQCLVGRHDFRSFETHWPNRLSSIRTIFSVNVYRHENTIRVEVTADGFLYNMMRAITGSLYQVGRGYWPADRVREALRKQDRREAGFNAPPEGLFLMWVQY